MRWLDCIAVLMGNHTDYVGINARCPDKGGYLM